MKTLIDYRRSYMFLLQGLGSSTDGYVHFQYFASILPLDLPDYRYIVATHTELVTKTLASKSYQHLCSWIIGIQATNAGFFFPHNTEVQAAASFNKVFSEFL